MSSLTFDRLVAALISTRGKSRILSHTRVISSESHDDVSLKRIINVPKTASALLRWIMQKDMQVTEANLYDTVSRADEIDHINSAAKVKLKSFVSLMAKYKLMARQPGFQHL